MTEQYSIVLYIHVPQLLYSLICQWTFRLLPCPSYCKQHCNEHWGICEFFTFGFLRVNAQKWYCWVILWLYSQFFKESPYHLPQQLHKFTLPPVVQEGSLFSTPSPDFIICRVFGDGHANWCEVISHCSFDLYFSDNQQYQHLIMSLLANIVCLLWENVYLGLLPIFLTGLVIFFNIKLQELFVNIFGLIPCQLHHFQIFSPILWVVFSFGLWFPLLCKSF